MGEGDVDVVGIGVGVGVGEEDGVAAGEMHDQIKTAARAIDQCFTLTVAATFLPGFATRRLLASRP